MYQLIDSYVTLTVNEVDRAYRVIGAGQYFIRIFGHDLDRLPEVFTVTIDQLTSLAVGVPPGRMIGCLDWLDGERMQIRLRDASAFN